MPGKNSGICHGCRGVGHFFGGCPIKRRRPDCEHVFQKFFVVERDTPNKGRFFKCCSCKCGFWDWCEEGEATGESSNARVPLARLANTLKLTTCVGCSNPKCSLITTNNCWSP